MKHTAKSMLEQIQDKSLNVFEWPIQSLTFNPLDHLWKDIEMALHQLSDLSDWSWEDVPAIMGETTQSLAPYVNITNLRPVSFHSCIKNVLISQFSSYPKLSDLLAASQNKYKAMHSAETALLAVSEALQNARENSMTSAFILLNLSAPWNTKWNTIFFCRLWQSWPGFHVM